jgi:purine-cytosine permease-like protein
MTETAAGREAQAAEGALTPAGHAPPPITEVEQYGIEPIPPEDRTATPFDLFRVAFGGANTFATVVLGAFPILVFGLSFWQEVANWLRNAAVSPRLSRFQSTLLIGALSIGIIYLGRFALDFVQTIVTFATLIIVCTTPWVIIMAIGYVVRRGFYRSDDLQVFNRGQRGGAYWFTRGVNVRGMAAWIPAAVAGLLFVNIPGQFEGPLRNTAERIGFTGLAGVDVSLVVAIALAALLYVAALLAFPEPRAVYGPDGPRFVRASAAEPPPILDTGKPPRAGAAAR